jgi:protein-disulfide isomerase
MRFAFRHFPLIQIHPWAEPAAEAAEAAGAQGKFWQMHDMLYEHQEALDFGSLRRYASAIGLDMLMFETGLESHRHLPKIQADYQSGLESGVEGTPTFFINGEMYTGNSDPTSLLSALEAALPH